MSRLFQSRRVYQGSAVVFALLMAGLLLGQAAAQRGLMLDQDNLPFPFPLMGTMRWTGSRLAGVDYPQGQHPILWTVDRQGVRESVAVDIPQAGYIGVRDVAAGPDGSLVAVGLAISDDSRKGVFLTWISPDKARQVITQVWPYDPEVLTVAPDGTIWAVGAVLNDHHVVVNPNVLRHYTQSGQVLASTIVRNVRKNGGGLYSVSSGSALMASTDRIGWLTETCQYIEFSFDAVQLNTYTCPNGYTSIHDVAGVALSSANDLLVGGKWPATLPPLELDRGTGTWKPVPVLMDPGNTGMLLGFDGLILVTNAKPLSTASHVMRRYVWHQPIAGGQ